MSTRVCLFVLVIIGILAFLQLNEQLSNYSLTSYYSSLSYYDGTTTTTTTTTSIDATLGVSDDATLEKKDMTATGSSISSPSPDSNRKGSSRRKITTIPGEQGFHFPLDLLEWNLPSPARLHDVVAGSSTSLPSSLSGRNFTRSICTTSRGGIFPAPWIKMMFNRTEWEFIPKSSETEDPSCSNSRIRVLWEGLIRTKPSQLPTLRQYIKQHAIGEQLTTTVLGARIDKELLWMLIQNQTTNNNDSSKDDHRTLLKDSLPTTRTFDSTTSCKNFCDGEWLKSQQRPQPQQWIWKPKNAMKGKGIVLVGVTATNSNKDDDGDGDDNDASSLEACHQHCEREGGESLLAQEVADAMRLPDGRKFDVRSYILVANVDPLVVFTGAEWVRVCAEPMNATSPEPYPGIPANSTWNPFQQVCNMGLGRKHPTPGVWTVEGNTGPLEKGIPDDAVRSRVLSKIEQHNHALVELLHHRWVGQVGMFEILAVDYLVDNSERISLLEVNDQPVSGVDNLGKIYINPWNDIFEIEWTILETYNQYGLADRSGGGGGSSSSSDGSSTWKQILQQRLSTLDLETLRMMPPL